MPIKFSKSSKPAPATRHQRRFEPRNPTRPYRNPQSYERMFENPVLGFASPKKGKIQSPSHYRPQQPHYRNPKFMSPLDSKKQPAALLRAIFCQ